MRRRNGVYDPIVEEVHISQLIRRHPTMDKLRPYDKKHIDAYANNYVNFLNAVKIAPDVVKEAIKMTEKTNFYSKGKNFYRIDKSESTFALVAFGKKSVREGLRIIYAHCDSPCLQTKTKPLLFEWDIDLRDLHLSVELDTFGYGGVHAHQWAGRRLNVVGWSVINGKRRNITFPVYSSEVSPHTDTREENETDFNEAHKKEYLDLATGDVSRKELLKRLKFRGEEDFARGRFYVVPITKAERLHKYYITGYGQDDRIGVFASVKALLESTPKYTTIVMGFDKEEVGSGGLGGAKGKFFEQTLDEILKVEENKKLENITSSLREEIYRSSIAMNADVDVGSTNREIDNIDERNVAKLGYGMFVSANDGLWDSDQQSPALVDRIMSVLQRRKVILQTIGSPTPADGNIIESMNRFFIERGIPTINCGVAVGSLHSPEEISHVGDLYNVIKGYKAFIEDPQRVVKKWRKRKK